MPAEREANGHDIVVVGGRRADQAVVVRDLLHRIHPEEEPTVVPVADEAS